MSIAVMKQALEALDHEANKGNDNAYQCERDALRAAIEQAEKPMAWFHADNYKTRFTTDPSEEMVGKYWKPLYTAPRQEPYDQTSLELCEECGWKAIIPGDGCLVCARQNAKPVAWRWKEVKGEFVGDWVLTEIEPPPYVTESMPLYAAPRQWVGLTDQEIKEIIGPWGDTPIKGYTRKLFDQIEEKLRGKNHAS